MSNPSTSEGLKGSTCLLRIVISFSLRDGRVRSQLHTVSVRMSAKSIWNLFKMSAAKSSILNSKISRTATDGLCAGPCPDPWACAWSEHRCLIMLAVQSCSGVWNLSVLIPWLLWTCAQWVRALWIRGRYTYLKQKIWIGLFMSSERVSSKWKNNL